MPDSREVHERILDIFSDVAASIGYSPLHGKIIGVLLIKGRPMSLQDLAKETGYSASMISLSLDLLDVLGIVKKIKKTADRKLYIEFSGDLLECLKKAFVMKLEKSISASLEEFGKIRSQNPGEAKALDVLENQIKRLDSYVRMLAEMNLP